MVMDESHIVEADQQGDLDEAISLASLQLLSLSEAPIDIRVARHIQLARVLRHRGLGDDLRRCLDAAQQAFRLASLPTCPTKWRPIAELAVASSHLALGDETACRRIVEPHTTLGSQVPPALAAWAWRLRGEAALARSDLFEAVPALLNTVAEERQARSAPGAESTPVLLLRAFSRIGHVLDAQRVLENTDPARMQPRRRLDLLLARAEHERRYGHIADALETLDDAEGLIDNGSGLDRRRVQLHLLRAACFDDWRLVTKAQEERHRAQDLNIPGTPPKPQADEASNHFVQLSSASLTSPHQPTTSVMDIIQGFQNLPCLRKSHAVALERALAALQGVPGGERTEALALVEAGSLLANGSPEVAVMAERLLRRALARLDYLEGTQLWQARCRSALGRLLSATAKEEALELLLAAVRGLSSERYCMKHRLDRSEWRMKVEKPPFAAAIELAHDLGRDEITAELIIHSRLSGVVSPQESLGLEEDIDTVSEVPLTPVPTLHHINGAVSSFGGTGRCRLL